MTIFQKWKNKKYEEKLFCFITDQNLSDFDGSDDRVSIDLNDANKNVRWSAAIKTLDWVVQTSIKP
jgi:hypothetical protein